MASSKVPGAVGSTAKQSNWLTNLFGSLVKKYSGTGLTGAEMEAHNLNVAETMRQERRQEDFYNQYQSIGAQVRQMEEAGINPAMAAGGISAASPVSGMSATPASASPGGDPLQAILGTISGIRALKAQKQELDIRAAEEKREQEEHERKIRMLDQDIWRKDFDNAHYEELYNTNREQQLLSIGKLRSDIASVDANTLFTYTKQSKEEVEKDILTYESLMRSIDAENHAKIVEAQLKYTEAQSKLVAATTAREQKALSKLDAEIRNLDADSAKKAVEESNLSEEGKRLKIEAEIARRTQEAVVSQAFSDLYNTDADTAKKAAEAMFYRGEFKSFDLERGKREIARAVSVATDAARALRTTPKK